MPCNTTTVQSVGGLENAVPDLVKAAFGSLPVDSAAWQVFDGWRVRLSSGEFVEWQPKEGLKIKASSQAEADRARGVVLRAYSKVAVTWAASRAGWRVQPVAGSENRLVVQRG